MPRTVTVGLDGSPESLAAAEWAAREAERRDLALHLVHAWDWQPYAQPVPDDATHRHWGGRVLREATERLRARHPDLKITSEQVALPPVTALLAASEDADPLVVGSRGLSGVAGFLVGSVGLSVLAQADRPVVLVRSTARPACWGMCVQLSVHDAATVKRHGKHGGRAAADHEVETARGTGAGPDEQVHDQAHPIHDLRSPAA
ncbi:universal stress protein [Streptomyces bobili]|uniref:universal stress protein n=1 Tax=Streptomyces bobili TaxID=67280 RepID=UPI003665720D